MKLLRETINLIVVFFKPYGLKDEILRIPSNVKRNGIKINLLTLAMTIFTLSFAFLLKVSNMLIECRLILLGLLAFMLYRGQRVLQDAYNIYWSSENNKFNLILEDEIVFRGSTIIGKVANRVLKFDKSSKIYQIMSNESVLGAIKTYLKFFWDQKIMHIFDIFEIVSVIIMLIVATVTNTTISQYLFIPLLVICSLICLLCSANVNINRASFVKINKNCRNEKDTILNDLLRVPLIVQQDLSMRINKLHGVVVKSNTNVKNFHKKLNWSQLLVSGFQLMAQYGIIIIYVLSIDWNSISLSTIVEIAANLVIVETALGYISRIADKFSDYSERLINLQSEEDDMRLILDTFNMELNKSSIVKEVSNIQINPFTIRYHGSSENDRSFTLTSADPIHIANGEIAILSGASGSGKSTFMEMLTGRIVLEKSTDIPETSRFLFYDETLKFGSFNIFQEIFCCTKNPDLGKMKEILENLHLWEEIQANCVNVWQWMQDKKFGFSLSNGQKQRLILAKILYWLDNDIDVVVLDECTSGLDEKSDSNSASAEKVLDYIIRYCNQDKHRIIIIASHQNLTGLQENLAGSYKFKNLLFSKKDDYNTVTSI